MWQNIDSLTKQINLITEQNIQATWLTVYSNLKDQSIVSQLTELNNTQEVGMFLEVDETLATDSQVSYLFGDGDWARPDKLLLSGYKVEERKRMIDTAFNEYKKHFGIYPVSVGAWYIDTVSLDYLVEKYGVKTVMDCSDQYRTDKYGLWGKPWGVPFRPSFYNSLFPAKIGENAKVVTIQWAQRDLVKGYGLGVADSTYSVQANDYIGHHKYNTDYFIKVASDYLLSPNSLNQLTIGLEVGQEGVEYESELIIQIESLKKMAIENNLVFMTMGRFAQVFSNKSSGDYFLATQNSDSNGVKSYWYGRENYRINIIKEGADFIIRDFRRYDDFIFADVFDRDSKPILERYLPSCIDGMLKKNSVVLFSDVTSVNYDRITDGVLFTVKEKSGKKDEVILNNRGVMINDRYLFELMDDNRSVMSNLVKKFALIYNIHQDHNRYSALSLSEVEGVKYFGVFIPPETFVGLTSKFPYLGRKKLPFQILSRFKNVPRIDPVNFLFTNLVKGEKSCKMNL